jgi:hypothetical protein
MAVACNDWMRECRERLLRCGHGFDLASSFKNHKNVGTSLRPENL